MNPSLIDLYVLCLNEYDRSANLPFVKNDALLIKNSFINGLNLLENNIRVYCGNISLRKYNEIIDEIISNSSEDRMVIFYYSGHGGIIDDKSTICLSDEKQLLCNSIINKIEKSKYPKRWFIFDSCYSGAILSSDKSSLEYDNIGEGTIINSSCSQLETSGADENGEYSKFTNQLCFAINSDSTIRKGSKSIDRINQLLRHIVNISNNKISNVKDKQSYIYKSNVIGNFYIGEIKEKQKKYNSPYIKKYENFEIVGIDPVHTVSVKKYSVDVITNNFDEERLLDISNQILEMASNFELYQNDKIKSFLYNKSINLIWIRFFIDDIYYAYNYHKCESSYNDGKFKLSFNNNCEEQLKYRLKNEIPKEELFKQIKELFKQSIELFYKLRVYYQKKNSDELLNENDFNDIDDICNNIRHVYNKFGNLEMSDYESENVYDRFSEYFSALDDFQLFMSKEGKKRWNDKSRTILIDFSLNKIDDFIEAFNKEQLLMDQLKMIEPKKIVIAQNGYDILRIIEMNSDKDKCSFKIVPMIDNNKFEINYEKLYSIPQKMEFNEEKKIEITYHKSDGIHVPKIHIKMINKETNISEYLTIPLERIIEPDVNSRFPIPLLTISIPKGISNKHINKKDKYNIFDVGNNNLVEVFLVNKNFVGSNFFENLIHISGTLFFSSFEIFTCGIMRATNIGNALNESHKNKGPVDFMMSSNISDDMGILLVMLNDINFNSKKLQLSFIENEFFLAHSINRKLLVDKELVSLYEYDIDNSTLSNEEKKKYKYDIEKNIKKLYSYEKNHIIQRNNIINYYNEIDKKMYEKISNMEK